MTFKTFFLFFIMSLFVSSCSVAEQKKTDDLQSSSIPAELKPLLKQEMQAVEKGMKELISSISAANWEKTASIGKKIQASYILKQSLTAEQIKHFHHSLPEQFIKLDHSFHQYAGMLAHAAEVKNADVVGFYFYKMNESCVQCHSSYAQDKFSGFSTDPDKAHMH